MLTNGDIAPLQVTICHFEKMCTRRRIIGLLQNQDFDGKPTFGFMVTGWSVNEMCLC